METKTHSHDERTASTLPACPVCSGPLVPLRGFFRCTRCSYSICESCEGGGDIEE